MHRVHEAQRWGNKKMSLYAPSPRPMGFRRPTQPPDGGGGSGHGDTLWTTRVKSCFSPSFRRRQVCSSEQDIGDNRCSRSARLTLPVYYVLPLIVGQGIRKITCTATGLVRGISPEYENAFAAPPEVVPTLKAVASFIRGQVTRSMLGARGKSTKKVRNCSSAQQ